MAYLFLTWLLSPYFWLRLLLQKKRPLRRVLVINTAKIGDFVATRQVFAVLRSRLPDAEIRALVHSVNVPLARHMSSIDKVIPLPPGGYSGWKGKKWLWRLLADVDGVLVLSPNLSTFLAPFWAGVACRVSVLPDRRAGSVRLAYPFLSHGQSHQPGRLFRDTAMLALRGLSIASEGVEGDAPLTIDSPGGRERVAEILPHDVSSLVGLGIGAGNRLKALTEAQLLQVVRGLLARTSATVVLIGSAPDQACATRLTEACGGVRIINAVGKFSLDELPELLRLLDCYLGVDSGVTYLADAVGIPVVDYMGPADAEDQRPLGKLVRVIRSTEPCAPCSHSFDAPYKCHMGTRACIVSAPLEQMVQAAVDILADSCC
ncbi:heptosyltransferase II [Oryzomicrobium terrae]|uniref:Heptosyltransferase II n=1 Tax=Oryzomicrobium terrae TaxID=1735038 RepID=A0A5C1EBU1_9RHOO|nr:glycosyltransferase family 9 protein [Oryzomicrobium terrae]QEL66352.1 heptosyltransferase II [Oryzomicrobium terrae]